jgi:nicotinate-nucleotide pyrophosphorylase (carboxylating)
LTLRDEVERLVDAALREDVGDGDRTTLWTVPAEARATARVVAKGEGVIAGTEIVRAVFARLSPEVRVVVAIGDGEEVEPGDVVLTAEGPARALLTGERTALNLLQRLSGVATLTRRFVRAVEGTGARILDTRKTTPGMRLLEKAAVRAGGGENHRVGLFDMVLIKENHIAAAGGITAAVEAVRRANQEGLEVEVETSTLAEVEEALRVTVDRVLLDNMDPATLRAAVARVRSTPEPRPLTEASGGVTLASVRQVAECGVDLISVGALTHSAPALDLSLLLDARE